MHAAFPLISLWDDHEVQNDYSGGAKRRWAARRRRATSKARRDTAYRAFFESMPTFAIGRQRLYHKASFGSLVDLFVLDERQYRAASPCASRRRLPRARMTRVRILGATPARVRSQRDQAFEGGVEGHRQRGPDHADEEDGRRPRRPRRVGRLPGRARGAATHDPRRRRRRFRHRRLPRVHLRRRQDPRRGDCRGRVRRRLGHLASDTEVLVDRQYCRASERPTRPTNPPSYTANQRIANPGIYDDLDYLHHGYVTCEATPKRFKTTFKKLETVRRQTTDLAESRTWTLRRGRPGLVR